jgi:hypothetical protein
LGVSNSRLGGENWSLAAARNDRKEKRVKRLSSRDTVSGNFYTPATVTACGLLFFQAGGVKQQKNTLFNNQTNLCNAGRGGGGFNP